MFSFNLGLITVYTAACIIALVTEQAVRVDNPWVITLVLVLWAVPIGAGWAGAELARAVRGPGLRVFAAAHSWWLARFMRGMIAGLLGVTGALAALVYINEPPNDAAVVGATAAIASFAILLIGRRVPAWACHACGYDLRGLTGAARGRCPECGQSDATTVNTIAHAREHETCPAP